MIRLASLTLILCLAASTAHAHVTVWPLESTAGAIEKYTVRVPTEGKVDTVSVLLEIPDNVHVYAVAAPLAWTYEVHRKGDRIVAIAWTMTIMPGEFGEFSFTAKNPDAKRITWKAKQRYLDGTSAEWTGEPGAKPGPVTTLRPAPSKASKF